MALPMPIKSSITMGWERFKHSHQHICGCWTYPQKYEFDINFLDILFLNSSQPMVIDDLIGIWSAITHLE